MARALAHIETVSKIDELPGYDRVVLATILGWRVIVNKEEIHKDDKVVYFEIDSLVPSEDKRFAFLEKKHYKIKTQKMCKAISQGLAMPLSEFPELGNPEIGTDVTDQLKVTYYSPEDRKRKSNPQVNKKDKYDRMCTRLAAQYPGIFNSFIVKRLRKTDWGKRFLYLFFGSNKKDIPKGWPSFIKHTDETRVENIPWVLQSKDSMVLTEKLNGTSTTVAVKKVPKLFYKDEYEFIVCSRNVRQVDKENIPYKDFESNVYWEMAEKYNLRHILTDYAKKYDYDSVVVQGECIGESIQGNPYKLKGRELYIFNLILNEKRVSSLYMENWCKEMGLFSVPILDTDYVIPEGITMETFKKFADGMSVINKNVKREGLVLRDQQGQMSFKNVSNEYLLKHQ